MRIRGRRRSRPRGPSSPPKAACASPTPASPVPICRRRSRGRSNGGRRSGSRSTATPTARRRCSTGSAICRSPSPGRSLSKAKSASRVPRSSTAASLPRRGCPSCTGSSATSRPTSRAGASVWRWTSGGPGTPVELDLVLTGLGLQPLIRDQFPGQDIPVVSGLAGRVRGTLTYDFDSREPLSGSGFADLSVEAVQQAGGLPLSGDLPITIEEGVLSSDDLHVTAPEQDLRIDGFQFSLPRVAGRLAYHLESRDLGRLAPLLLEDLKPGEERPFWVPTAGQGTLAGEVTIDRTDYVAQVQLDLRNAVTPDLTAQAVRGSLRLRPGAVEDLQLALSEEPGTLTVS